MDQIFEKVKEIIMDQLDVDEDMITMDASFADDLEADSLDVVELMMAMEEEFDIEISDEEAVGIVTIGDAVSYLADMQ